LRSPLNSISLDGGTLVKAIIIRSSSVVALSLALTRIAVGEEKPVDSLAVLKRALSVRGNTTISVVKTSAGREVHYCPDNTCDIFKAPNSAPQGALADFAFTYIFYASGYTYLQDFVTKTGKQYSKAILDRNRSGCTNEEEIDLASCVLRSLSRRYSIRAFFTRDDEGATNEMAVDLESTAAVNELNRVRAWQLEQWRSHP
jgi:hypothetical protein